MISILSGWRSYEVRTRLRVDELFAQILEVIRTPGRFAGGTFHQVLRRSALPLTMDLLPEPGEQVLIFTTRQIGFQRGIVQCRAVHELGGVQVAHCVGRKIAEGAQAPM